MLHYNEYGARKRVKQLYFLPCPDSCFVERDNSHWWSLSDRSEPFWDFSEIKQSSFCIFNMITVSSLQTSITLSLQRPLAQHRLVGSKCNQLTRAEERKTQVLDTFSIPLRVRSFSVPFCVGTFSVPLCVGSAHQPCLWLSAPVPLLANPDWHWKGRLQFYTIGSLLTVLRHIHALLCGHVIALFFWGQVWNLHEHKVH